MMRWRILKTLVHKETLRHATNRGGLVLAGLLITASLLLAALNPAGDQDRPATLAGRIHHCIIWYDDDSDWIDHLRTNIPAGLKSNILFYRTEQAIGFNEYIKNYETGTGGIEIRTMTNPDGLVRHRVSVRYSSGDRPGMAIYESWFCRETQRFFHARATQNLRKAGVNVDREFPLPILDDELWAQQQAFQSMTDRYAALANG